MNDQVPMSQAAYDELEAEIEKLETVERPKIAAKISVAREDGDLKENAEYHAAKNDQSFLETRILQLREQRQHAVIIEATGNETEIGFGSTFTLLDSTSGKEVTYTIVASYEQDASAGKLSNSSPVAEAVIGKSKGDKVTVNLPNGKQRGFEVVKLG
ncbi:MAG: transcription elongation factor GreA [Thermoleophilaceae bacterium]|nr:transcription elongation factor GreA [Thermoleophilaceae bacterium]